MLDTHNEDSSLEQEPQEFIPPKKQSWLRSFWEIIRFTLIALAIVIPVRVFIAQPFVVSGESMFPTFEDGDYLIIDEISYRLNEPERGDVIVFRYPLQTDRFFIKRIIALPGEVISLQDGTITITDKYDVTFTLDEPYIDELPEGDFELRLLGTEYFVMGDNRDASSDSRLWGPLERKYITGRALLRLLPTSEIGILPGDYKQQDN